MMREKYDLIKSAIEARHSYLSITSTEHSKGPFDSVKDIDAIKKQMDPCLKDISCLCENKFIEKHRNLICISLRFYYYELGMIKQASCSRRENCWKQMEQTKKIGNEICRGICPDSKEIGKVCPKIYPCSKDTVDPF